MLKQQNQKDKKIKPAKFIISILTTTTLVNRHGNKTKQKTIWFAMQKVFFISKKKIMPREHQETIKSLQH